MGRAGWYFYNRRQDPENFPFDRFCPISTDGARTLDGLEAKRIQRSTVARDRPISQSALLGDYENMAQRFHWCEQWLGRTFRIITKGGDQRWDQPAEKFTGATNRNRIPLHRLRPTGAFPLRLACHMLVVLPVLQTAVMHYKSEEKCQCG
jgi:hypothetical protein